MATIAAKAFMERETRDELKSIKQKTELYEASPTKALARMVENGHLCWIQREPNKRWTPPQIDIKDFT
jgi:hypothetical protein